MNKEPSLRTLAILLTLALPAAAAGCGAAESAPPVEELGERVAQPIVGGAPASDYPEAALVNMPGSICSGAVIAPRVVLTAGHCVTGKSSWTVVTPYAQKQTAKSTQAWTEYVDGGAYVNSSTNDVAVLVLDKPIELPAYPALASAPVPSGTKAVNVGRKKDGVASYSALFAGAEITLQRGNSYGFPFSYRSQELIEPGDSGGPVYVGSGSARKIVAVNSGSGGGTQVLARVDLAYAKIQELIAANGGGGAGSASAGGTDAGAPPSSDAGAPQAAPGASACGGASEVEPNDASTSANALADARCGALADGADVDWYTWDLDAPGIAYEIALAAADDADILVWKRSGSSWSRITNTSPTKVAATSAGGGTYVAAVRSPSARAQAYRVTVAR